MVGGAADLVCPEAVGTAPLFRVKGERLGVHPALRLFPPRRQLAGFEPEHLLVGHGEGIHGVVAAPALREALAGARRRAPRWLGERLRAPLRRRGAAGD